jgi:hypothetical protein
MTVSVTALLRSRGGRRHGVPREVRGCPERALRDFTLDPTSDYEIMVETFDPVGSASGDRRLRRGGTKKAHGIDSDPPPTRLRSTELSVEDNLISSMSSIRRHVTHRPSAW